MKTWLLLGVITCGVGLSGLVRQRTAPDLEALPFSPRHYVAYRATAPIAIDGRLDDPAWAGAPWTEAFVDIQGERGPAPRFQTRARMLWDDESFYVAAELEEPEVWGTLTERDSVIFHDNDFEVFIDPDGDTHGYYELEVNALATPWDLLLIKPYRDGGPAINGWDIAGLRVGVDVQGSVNRRGDRDRGWTVELAMPWKALKEFAPRQAAPAAGERWRVNFSRVEWQVDPGDGAYTKRRKPGSSETLPEDNWVWSPQGAIDMHMPERWGYVEFSSKSGGAAAAPFVEDPNERVKWALRRLYYRQRDLQRTSGAYATTLEPLAAANIQVEGLAFRPVLQTTRSQYEITAPGVAGAILHLNQDGRVWLTR